MFGIFLFGIVCLWGILCICFTYLAYRWLVRPLVNRLSTKLSDDNKFLLAGMGALVFSCGLFFLPVADEIIAKPEMDALCKGAGRYEYDPEKAFGKTVYRAPRTTEYKRLLTGIVITIERGGYVDTDTNRALITYYEVMPSGGIFGFPDAGGNKHPWLLSECAFAKTEAAIAHRQKILYQDLKLQLIESR